VSLLSGFLLYGNDLCEFCGYSWTSACRNFGKRSYDAAKGKQAHSVAQGSNLGLENSKQEARKLDEAKNPGRGSVQTT
jgi:hypothetical protein